MASPTDVSDRPASRPWLRWLAYGVVIVAAVLRFYNLSSESLWLDELWALEAADGHGSEHESLPVDRLIVAPADLTHVAAARSVWRVWTGLDQITHPPASYLLLRGWVDLFGTSEAALRSLSAACGTLAVVMLFVAVRPWAGAEPALWAAGLMAVAGPQVHAGRDARPYALLTLLAAATLWLVGRTVRRGPTRTRTLGLGLLLFASLLTHYFAVATVAAVAAYGLWFTRAAVRRSLVGAALAAGGLFGLVWGPFMWRQRPAFSPTDRGVVFLHEVSPGHVAATLWRLVTLPASMLADARPIPAAYAALGALGYLVVVTACVKRRWPAVWPLWFAGVVGLVATLDLARSTAHLAYLRYTLAASPVVYVGLALLPTVQRALGRLAAAAAVAFAAWSLPATYAAHNEDFRALADAVRASVVSGQPIVFAGPSRTFAPQILYLATSHYAWPLAGPVMLLEAPAAPAVMAQLRDRPTVWMVADPQVRLARQWLPGYHLAAGQSWPVVGSLLQMERDPTSAPTP